MGSVNVSRRAVLAGIGSMVLMGCGCAKKSDKSDDSKKKKKSEKKIQITASLAG